MAAAARRRGRARRARGGRPFWRRCSRRWSCWPARPRRRDPAGNAGQAIEITADTLEVRQSENVAVFAGAVNAIQGDMVLNADVLTVYYREAQGGQGNLGVSRIEAEGNVVVSSPQETAQGERGVYDVEQARIDLAGAVVLNSGNNVIQGETLTMDLATGVSKVSGAASGRVTGLFVPDEEGE